MGEKRRTLRKCTKLHFTHSFLACAAVALTFTATAHAGNSVDRTFVATTGDDANTAVKCSNSAPCRTLTAALTVTNPSGEIVVASSGGYGPVTITQPVTISGTGVVASITQTTTGQNAITITTSGNVTLIGLILHAGPGAWIYR